MKMKTYIEPQEAVALKPYTSAAHASVAVDVVKAYFSENKFDEQRPDLTAFKVFAVLYNAGRVDGIRSERAKRKAAQA